MKKHLFAAFAAFTATISLNGDLPQTKVADPTAGIEYKTQDPQELKDLHDSAIVSQRFVELLDASEFQKGWNEASDYLRIVTPQGEWDKFMEISRKPLGGLVSRKIANQRTAKNPPNQPSGDYIVLFYDTDFANRKNAHELVTLVKEGGEWKVYTYQVN